MRTKKAVTTYIANPRNFRAESALRRAALDRFHKLGERSPTVRLQGHGADAILATIHSRQNVTFRPITAPHHTHRLIGRLLVAAAGLALAMLATSIL